MNITFINLIFPFPIPNVYSRDVECINIWRCAREITELHVRINIFRISRTKIKLSFGKVKGSKFIQFGIQFRHFLINFNRQ